MLNLVMHCVIADIPCKNTGLQYEVDGKAAV